MRTKPSGAARKSFSITSPSSNIPSPHAQRLEAGCRHSLIVSQGVRSAREGVQRRHLVDPVSLVRCALGALVLRTPRADGAVLCTAQELRVTRPPACPFFTQPHSARQSRGGGGHHWSFISPLRRPIFCPSLPGPQSLGCRAALRSLRFLQTPQHTLPPPPTPRSGYRLMKCSFSSVICFVFLQSSDK